MARRKKKQDPIISQLSKGLAETAKRMTGSLALMITNEQPQEDIMYYDPLRDPVNFVKKPLGQGVREQMRAYLSSISGAMAGLTLLYERYPWLLSKEDYQYLEDNWFKVESITVLSKK